MTAPEVVSGDVAGALPKGSQVVEVDERGVAPRSARVWTLNGTGLVRTFALRHFVIVHVAEP